MTEFEDGIIHQGSFIVVIDANTGEIKLKNFTTSHSLGNTMKLASDGRFCGMDLGDNFPRGIHHWVFDHKKF